jgi:hypothetical protein
MGGSRKAYLKEAKALLSASLDDFWCPAPTTGFVGLISEALSV